MELLDIIGYTGVLILLLSLIPIGKKQKVLLILTGLLVLLIYSILKPIFPIAGLCIIALFLVIFEIRKSLRKKTAIQMIEVEYDNNYIVNFIENYKKDIYSFFPFYVPHKNHKCFLVMRDMNLAGIFIGNLNDDKLTIEVDYIKPIYRDNFIGKYIYIKNTGFFKKMGVSLLIGKSFHSAHSNFLKKMGFLKTYIDDQMFYVKSID